MTLTLQIPESVAGDMSPAALEREVLEAYAVESYRARKISMAQICELLGHESRWETQKFLADRDAWNCLTADEIVADAETAARFSRPRP
jgi:predicted HTH domain antitoxin